MLFPRVEGPSPEAKASSDAILRVAQRLREDAAKIEADAAEAASRPERDHEDG
jgi:hypothetical protein